MLLHLKKIPYFVLLLPFFFVLHGYLENFGFITIRDAAALALTYCIFTICVFVLSWLLFRNINKAAVMTTAWMAVYLFFGAFFDFLKLNSPVRLLWKYSFLIPMIFIFLLLLFIYLLKVKRKFYRLTLFLNVLLFIYIIVDIFLGLWKVIDPPSSKLAVYDFARRNQVKIPDTCAKPDIYFLLFDEYASSISLKERYNFENDIDTFFTNKGFSIQSKSISNYNFTPFSMAATFNMSYLEWLHANTDVRRQDYLQCNPEIRENELIRLLGTNGYELLNLSMFDLAGHPSRVKQSFLPVKGKMIAEGTLFPRLYRDFEWFFLKNKILSKLLKRDYVFRQIANNNLFLQEVMAHSTRKRKQPVFLYAHLYLPHGPFFFDEHGRRQTTTSGVRSPQAYLKYVRYTNKRIREVVQTILNNTNGQAVIIILSDHGFRMSTNERHPIWAFQNMNAVYFPKRNYQLFYDSISNVNQFRVVLNSLFAQKLPMLKDSTIYLFDKEMTRWDGDNKQIQPPE